jgi:hypothetical protein
MRSPCHQGVSLSILLAQLQSLIVVLLAVTVIAFARDETIEAIAILMVIGLNVLIGFIPHGGQSRHFQHCNSYKALSQHIIGRATSNEHIFLTSFGTAIGCPFYKPAVIHHQAWDDG